MPHWVSAASLSWEGKIKESEKAMSSIFDNVTKILNY